MTAPSLQTVVQLAAGMYRKMNFTSNTFGCCVASGIDEYVHMAVQVAKNASLRLDISGRIAALRDNVYDDDTSLQEWGGLLSRLGQQARARSATSGTLSKVQ